jgi:transcriptional regulator with XRE-family HTH domain
MEKEKDPAEIFSARLKTAREMREWSQVELGRKAELPASSVAHFEAGSRKPSFDTLRRLAIALDVTTDYLLGRDDDPAVAQAGDPLFRDLGKLSGRDRDQAEKFLKFLAQQSQEGSHDK